MNRVVTPAVSIVSSALWIGVPSAVMAQDRTGAWASFSAGVAAIDASPPAEDATRKAVAVNNIALGGWLNQRWQIAFDVGWLEVDAAGDLREPVIPVSVSTLVAYYPSLSSGFHVKGSVGAVAAIMTIVDEFGTKASAGLGTGVSVMAGTGWDVRLFRRIWLVPGVNFRFGQPGDLVLARRTRVTGWKYNTVDVTVGVRFD